MEQKQYFIRIGDMLVAVTKEQYLAYYRAERRLRYFERDIKTETAIRDKDGKVVCYAPSKEDSLVNMPLKIATQTALNLTSEPSKFDSATVENFTH